MISSRMALPPATSQHVFEILVPPVIERGEDRMDECGGGRDTLQKRKRRKRRTTIYCNALFGISLFCSKADMNLLLGLSPVLISGYDTVNSNPKRWDVGSRILMILYPAH